MARSTRVLEAESLALGTDASLAELAASGEVAAFEELYRRHSQAAWRVAQAVTGNGHDAADAVAEAFTRVLKALPAGRLNDAGAFRPYLLAATRNAALDVLRRAGRLRPSDTMEDYDEAAPLSTPSDKVIDLADKSMVAAAFLALPERWRSVLWLTEVEGIPAREAAEMLGLSANGVAQLAVRARAGLRERFLQAHLRDGFREECRYTVEHLGAYVGGGLAARDIAKVDQHLAGCAECRERKEELDELGSTLRRAVIPVPIALAALTLSKFKAVHRTAASVSRPLSDGTAHWLERAGWMATGTLAAIGLIGLGLVGDGDDDLTPQHGPQTQLVSPSTNAIDPDLLDDDLTDAETDSSGSSGGEGASTFAGDLSALAAGPAPSATPAPLPLQGTTPPPGDTPEEPPAAGPVVQVNLRIGPGTDSLGAGLGAGEGSCLGVDLAGTFLGCQPPAHTDPASTVTVSTAGELLGDNAIAL